MRPPQPNGHVIAGDVVYIESVGEGSFVDVEGEAVQVRWTDKGAWQQFTIGLEEVADFTRAVWSTFLAA